MSAVSRALVALPISPAIYVINPLHMASFAKMLWTRILPSQDRHDTVFANLGFSAMVEMKQGRASLAKALARQEGRAL